MDSKRNDERGEGAEDIVVVVVGQAAVVVGVLASLAASLALIRDKARDWDYGK